MDELLKLMRRLNSLGIELTLGCNYPWIYLESVNGKAVEGAFYGNHGFTVAFRTEKKLTDRRAVFKKIRACL